MLDSPGPAVLVHGDLHGDNQVWDRYELRLVVDFENIGAAEPEYALRAFPGPGMGPGTKLVNPIIRHYHPPPQSLELLSGRFSALSIDPEPPPAANQR